MESDKDEIVEEVFQSIANGQNILLHGPGGSGKSFTIRKIAIYFKRKGKIVFCCATTGIAAINLSIPEEEIAGCTLHSWAGVGLGDAPPQKLVARVQHDERARKRWKETDILIIDEVSMLGAEFIDKLDFIGREVRRVKDKPFGGLQLVFSGDFLQLPPVNANWAFNSCVWKEMGDNLFPFILEKAKRYEDLDWFQLLLRIRRGKHTAQDIKFLHSKVKAYEVWVNSPASKDITSVKPTMLHSKKVDVEYQNDRELKKLPGTAKEFIAVDDFKPYNGHARFDHYIKPLDEAIPKAIYLNVGAQVMLKANLDVKGGLANGSRGVVTEIIYGPEGGIRVKWLNGKTTIVTSHTWTQEDKDGRASRTQIPLILAWALTVHRAQGCTLDYCIADLGPSVFLEGQAYVALSRVRSSQGLFLVEFYPPGIKTNGAALEYVESLENVEKQIEIVYVLHYVGLDPESDDE